MPLITGSSSDQLNRGRTYTFTPFARASQFARAQLQMAKLGNEQAKIAVIFENTAFGTSTSNGLKELAPSEGVEIVMFEPYSAGFTDASPLFNKVKSSCANALFSLSYLNDLILIVRTVKQVGPDRDQWRLRPFVMPDFYKTRQACRRPARRAHWNHDVSDDAQKVNVEFKKRTGELRSNMPAAWWRRPSCWPTRWNAPLPPIRKKSAKPCRRSMSPATPRWRRAARSNSTGWQERLRRPVGVQNGDLASVFPKEDARAPLLKLWAYRHVGDWPRPSSTACSSAASMHCQHRIR